MLFAATPASLGQSRESANVCAASRLGRTLLHVHSVPVKHGNPHEMDYQFKDTGGAPLKPYRRMAGQICSEAVVLVRIQKSGHRDDFKFKNLPTDSYWLSADVDGREYVMPIEHQLAKEEDAESSSHFKYEIYDSGKFEFFTKSL